MKREDGRTIPVVMCFDADYGFPACVTAASVMEHARPEDRYVFLFLTAPETASRDEGYFAALAGRYPGFSWRYVPVDTGRFEGIRRTIPHVSNATFYRLMIPQAVREYDRCLYLDGDMLVLGDVSRILEECETAGKDGCEEWYLAASRDLYLSQEALDWTGPHLTGLGMENDRERYFNAGVMVMNLKALRRDRMTERFLSLLERQYYFADQDILNVACRGRVRYLPVRYNLVASQIGNLDTAFGGRFSEEDCRDIAQARPFVCHFAGTGKPWEKIETDWEYRWYETALRLPRTDSIVRQLQTLRTKIADRPRADCLPAVRSAGSVILYGFSEAGLRLCRQLKRLGLTNVAAFCDGDPAKAGRLCEGVRCFGPEILSGLAEDAVIVICPQKTSSRREIFRTLTGRGIGPARIFRFRSRDSRIIDIDQEEET